MKFNLAVSVATPSNAYKVFFIRNDIVDLVEGPSSGVDAHRFCAKLRVELVCPILLKLEVVIAVERQFLIHL